MKPKPISLALIFTIGVALCGVNWCLNHPPLSDTDEEFRALVAGADSVEVKTSICQNPNCTRFVRHEYRELDSSQTRELIELIRLINRTPAQFSRTQGDISVSILSFHRQKKELLPEFGLIRMANWSELQLASGGYAIHPRFEKPLRLFLDQVAPMRIQP